MSTCALDELSPCLSSLLPSSISFLNLPPLSSPRPPSLQTTYHHAPALLILRGVLGGVAGCSSLCPCVSCHIIMVLTTGRGDTNPTILNRGPILSRWRFRISSSSGVRLIFFPVGGGCATFAGAWLGFVAGAWGVSGVGARSGPAAHSPGAAWLRSTLHSPRSALVPLRRISVSYGWLRDICGYS